MPIDSPMVAILIGALLIQIASVPVAVHGHGLRAPMRPEGEFGVAEPLWAFKPAQRFPSRLEGAVGNGQGHAISFLMGRCVLAGEPANLRAWRPARDTFGC